MITRVEVFLKRLRRIFSRSGWTIRLLGLSQLKHPVQSPGLVMVQIDGLSSRQFQRGMERGHMPFLKSLLEKEHYKLHPFYSGLPSNTPAVQAEIFYGIKGCVPAFSFVDRTLNRPIKMFDASYVEQFEPRLKAQAKGLLEGGSSYSNIYTGGAQESHFCWAQLGLGGVLHAANPLVLPFLVILYIDIFFRVFVLLAIEFFLAIYECARGTLKGRLFFRELEMIWLRSLVCVLLREFIVAGVCMDIVRGLPVIHLNFLGYDEQAHCRGPSSRFAHWSLEGIDDAIKRIHNVMNQSLNRHYDLWVYADHGQEKTTPYLIKFGRTLEAAVDELFESETQSSAPQKNYPDGTKGRASLLRQKRKSTAARTDSKEIYVKPKVIVTAMGPLGHIYIDRPLDSQELAAYAQKLVSDLGIPLVLTKNQSQILAWTKRGCFNYPQQATDVFGEDHPYLEDMKEDLVRVCNHPDAGEFVIAGWCKGELAISFPIEYGAHASMGPEETSAFALLPMDAPIAKQPKTYLRPSDLHDAAQEFLHKRTSRFSLDKETNHLRLMSYNTHGCLGMDGRISIDRIARVISRHSPEVVALQELDVGRRRSDGLDQVKAIAEKLGMHYYFQPSFHSKGEQYGNALLSRQPLTIVKMAALPQRLDKKKYEPRGAMWASLEFKGTRVQIINTHLSIWPQERLLQANALLGKQWLGSVDAHEPIVLCGDFNTLPNSTTYQTICQRLQDTQLILKGHRPMRTWYGRYPLSQIDYIFVSEGFQVKHIAVPRTALDKVASDHLPLVVDLEFIHAPSVSMKE